MESEQDLVKSVLVYRQLIAGARRIGVAMLDQLYPPACLICDGPIAAANSVCGSCFPLLRPITVPLCQRLGIPFEVSFAGDELSAQALAEPPPFDRARAALVYNEAARMLVSRLKYGDRPELAVFCARLMAQAGHEFWAQKPVLVPVPLHRGRQFSRRYNQSGELARALGKLVGLEVDPFLIRRVRATRQQVGLTATARERNVAGAFALHGDGLARLAGRGVVLIDDVLTTGSTVNAITRTLQRSGAQKIDVLTFARVVIGSDVTI